MGFLRGVSSHSLTSILVEAPRSMLMELSIDTLLRRSLCWLSRVTFVSCDVRDEEAILEIKIVRNLVEKFVKR